MYRVAVLLALRESVGMKRGLDPAMKFLGHSRRFGFSQIHEVILLGDDPHEFALSVKLLQLLLGRLPDSPSVFDVDPDAPPRSWEARREWKRLVEIKRALEAAA